jgi:hypothetical protein
LNKYSITRERFKLKFIRIFLSTVIGMLLIMNCPFIEEKSKSKSFEKATVNKNTSLNTPGVDES